jgi:hypothetical protein
MTQTTMPLATKRRALELGAQFIENDLGKLRAGAVRCYEAAERLGEPESVQPVTHSHEHDVMKAAEWASAATWLRALAEREA